MVTRWERVVFRSILLSLCLAVLGCGTEPGRKNGAAASLRKPTPTPVPPSNVERARVTADTLRFGDVVVGTRATGSGTLRIGGTQVISLAAAPTLPAPFSYVGGVYPGTGGSCGMTLTPGTCRIVVEFAPTEHSSHLVTLAVSFRAGTRSGHFELSLNGEGAYPPPTPIPAGVGGCGPGGQNYQGTCYYHGDSLQSCETVCGPHGGYSILTDTKIGTYGTLADCGNVAALFGFTKAPREWPFSLTPDALKSCGCSTMGSNGVYRFQGNRTGPLCSFGDVRRFCACNQ